MGKKLILFFFIFYFACNAIAAEAIKTQKTNVSNAELQRFTTVVEAIRKHYLHPTSDKELFNAAIHGVISGLDPHSAYFEGDDYDNDIKPLYTGTYVGVGFILVPSNGLIKVAGVMDNSPADKAGMKVGDIVIQINGKLVKDMNLKDVINPTHDRKGTKVTVTVLHRDESKPQNLILIRDIIKIPPVKWRLLTPNYGYINILVFKERTSDEVEKAIAGLKKAAKNKLQGVVIDLRNNGGGFINEAVQVANYLLDFDKLKENKLIVYTKGQNYNTTNTASAMNGSLLHNVPIVVLINGGTMSSAELLAGALQDHKRAIIAGEKSGGKGVLQKILTLDKQSQLKLSTALNYTPYGRSIQAKGIVPDVIVGNIQLSKSNKRTQKTWSTRQNSELSLARKDYQLYKALHLLEAVNALGDKQFVIMPPNLH